MFTTNAKNQLLDGLTVSEFSLHTAFPGATGANEVTGGSYARKPAALGVASGEVRTASSVTFDVPATTVRWVGGWDGTTFKCCAPNGGNPKEFMADPTADTITCPSHGYSDGDAVTFYGATPPAPLVQGTVYYVVGSATHTFQVSTTAGGVALDLTDYGSGGCQVSAIFQDTYAAADTHTITSATFGLPF
jgi:hypothetical protein